jgi:hypothetical protein
MFSCLRQPGYNQRSQFPEGQQKKTTPGDRNTVPEEPERTWKNPEGSWKNPEATRKNPDRTQKEPGKRYINVKDNVNVNVNVRVRINIKVNTNINLKEIPGNARRLTAICLRRKNPMKIG